MKFQERAERRLDKGINRRDDSGDEPKTAYRKIGDSVVDGLLLRDLLLHVSNTRRNNHVVAHLVVGDRLLELFDEFHHLIGIPALVHKPGRSAFCQQHLRSFFDLLQCAAGVVGRGGRG